MNNRPGDIVPVPDPTVLTTASLERIEHVLRNLIDTEILHVTDLFEQKLRNLLVRFEMLEGRTAEQKKDTKDALDAALAAQKEAVASQTASSEKSITKMETAAIERIKAVETLLSTSTNASNDKVDDLKSRIVAIEATKFGNTEMSTSIHSNIAVIVSVITTMISIISAVALFVTYNRTVPNIH